MRLRRRQHTPSQSGKTQ